MSVNVAVLGGGPGACTVAAELALQECRVRLWELPRFFSVLTAIQQIAVIEATGAVEGEAELDLVTDDISLACEDADVIFVVTQAVGHREVGRILAPIVSDSQIIVVNPGSTGCALEFARVFAEAGGAMPVIAETSTLTHACRMTWERGIVMRLRVGLVKTAAFPADRIEGVVALLKPFLPSLVPATNVLETMLSNGNAVIHPPIMLLNTGTVERSQGQWEFYEEGVTRYPLGGRGAGSG